MKEIIEYLLMGMIEYRKKLMRMIAYFPYFK
jgi:hypothetical protein